MLQVLEQSAGSSGGSGSSHCLGACTIDLAPIVTELIAETHGSAHNRQMQTHRSAMQAEPFLAQARVAMALPLQPVYASDPSDPSSSTSLGALDVEACYLCMLPSPADQEDEQAQEEEEQAACADAGEEARAPLSQLHTRLAAGTSAGAGADTAAEDEEAAGVSQTSQLAGSTQLALLMEELSLLGHGLSRRWRHACKDGDAGDAHAGADIDVHASGEAHAHALVERVKQDRPDHPLFCSSTGSQQAAAGLAADAAVAVADEGQSRADASNGRGVPGLSMNWQLNIPSASAAAATASATPAGSSSHTPAAASAGAGLTEALLAAHTSATAVHMHHHGVLHGTLGLQHGQHVNVHGPMLGYDHGTPSMRDILEHAPTGNQPHAHDPYAPDTDAIYAVPSRMALPSAGQLHGGPARPGAMRLATCSEDGGAHAVVLQGTCVSESSDDTDELLMRKAGAGDATIQHGLDLQPHATGGYESAASHLASAAAAAAAAARQPPTSPNLLGDDWMFEFSR